jgi:periplasmic protein TonB
MKPPWPVFIPGIPVTERPISTEFMIAILLAMLAHALLFLNLHYKNTAPSREYHETISVSLSPIRSELPSEPEPPAPPPAAPETPAAPAAPKPPPPKPVSKKPKPLATTPQKQARKQAPPVKKEPPTNEPSSSTKAAPKARPPQASSATLLAVESKYLEELRNAIMQHRQYPGVARRKHKEGTATIAFIILGDGRIRDSRIETSSGFHSLDRAALRAVTELGRFDPIPEALHREQWQLTVSLQFKLR